MTAKGKIATANLVPGETRILVRHIAGLLEIATKLTGHSVARVLKVERAERGAYETATAYLVHTTEGVIRAFGHQTFKLAGDSRTELNHAWVLAHLEATTRVLAGIDVPKERHLSEQEMGEAGLVPEPTTLAAAEALDSPVVPGRIDKAAILAKPIDSLMNSGVLDAVAEALDSSVVLDALHAEAEQEAREDAWRAEAQQMEDTGFGSLLEHFKTIYGGTPFGETLAYRAALNHLHGQALEEHSWRTQLAGRSVRPEGWELVPAVFTIDTPRTPQNS